MLFYQNAIYALACASFSMLFENVYANLLGKKRREKLLDGFRDALYVMSGAVAAGHQMPLAISNAAEQSAVTDGMRSDIYLELKHICEMYEQNHSRIEDLLLDFAKRSNLEEISQFAAAYEICRKNGGDVESVCLRSADLLIDKIEFQNESNALVSEKKLDIALLTAMPVLMIAFLNAVSPGYLAPLYGNPQGITIMTAGLLGIAAALLLSLKIIDIKI